MPKAEQLRRNVVFNTAGNLLFFGCQYLTSLLVVWLGGYEDAGYLATAMTVANVALSFACYGMRTYQVSDLEGVYSDRTYLQSRYITLVLALLASAVFALANSYSALQRAIILVYTGCRLVEAYVDVWHGFLQKDERMDLVGISFGARGLLSIITFAGGLVLCKDLMTTLLVMLAANLLYALLADRPQGAKRAQWQKAGSKGVISLLWVCAPLAAYSFLNTAIGSVPKYFCERMLGTVQMGYFNSIFSPVAIIQVGATYLFVPFITTFAKLWNKKDIRGFLKGVAVCAALLFGLFWLGMAGVALLGRWALGILYYTRPEILDYTFLLYPLVGATIVTSFSLILCHLLTIMRSMKGLIIGNVCGIAASIAASLAFTGPLGLTGTALANLLGVTAQAAVLFAFLVAGCRKAAKAADKN